MSNPAVAARSGTPDYHAGMPTEAGAPDRDSIPKGSTRVVYAALARNVANAAAKFVAYGLSHSSSPRTEAIHSLVDS